MAEKKKQELDSLEMRIDVTIPHSPNLYVSLPDDLLAWGAVIKKQLDEDGYIRMRVNNLPTGCGGVGIYFGAGYLKDQNDDEAFHLVVSRGTLGQMIQALQLAHDNYIP